MDFTPTPSAIEDAVSWLCQQSARTPGPRGEIYRDQLVRIAQDAIMELERSKEREG